MISHRSHKKPVAVLMDAVAAALLRSRADDLILEELTRATEVDTAEEAKVIAQTEIIIDLFSFPDHPMLTIIGASTQVLLRSVAKKC